MLVTCRHSRLTFSSAGVANRATRKTTPPTQWLAVSKMVFNRRTGSDRLSLFRQPRRALSDTMEQSHEPA